MARFDRKNPVTWYLVQIVEYLLIFAVLGRIVPDSTPRWLQVVILVVVVVSVFVLNYVVAEDRPLVAVARRFRRTAPLTRVTSR